MNTDDENRAGMVLFRLATLRILKIPDSVKEVLDQRCSSYIYDV